MFLLVSLSLVPVLAKLPRFPSNADCGEVFWHVAFRRKGSSSSSSSRASLALTSSLSLSLSLVPGWAEAEAAGLLQPRIMNALVASCEWRPSAAGISLRGFNSSQVSWVYLCSELRDRQTDRAFLGLFPSIPCVLSWQYNDKKINSTLSWLNK